MAATVGLTNDVLQISGDSGYDAATVTKNTNGDVNVIYFNGERNAQLTFSVKYNIREIVFIGGDGGSFFANSTSLRNNALGGTGEDNFQGGSGADTFSGFGGVDALQGGGGNDVLYGGDDADRLNGGGGDDQLFGGAGDDDLDGSYGNDELHGGEGRDMLDGGYDNDRLFGDNGWDHLNGYFGDDYLDGGNDIYCDICDGGPGADTLILSPVESLINRPYIVLDEGDVAVVNY